MLQAFNDPIYFHAQHIICNHLINNCLLFTLPNTVTCRAYQLRMETDWVVAATQQVTYTIAATGNVSVAHGPNLFPYTPIPLRRLVLPDVLSNQCLSATSTQTTQAGVACDCILPVTGMAYGPGAVGRPQCGCAVLAAAYSSTAIHVSYADASAEQLQRWPAGHSRLSILARRASLIGGRVSGCDGLPTHHETVSALKQ